MTQDESQATTEDAVDLLLKQHGQIRTLFADVETSSGDQRQEHFQALLRLLAVHETAEELVIRPLSREAAGDEIVDERLREETEAKKVLADLDGEDVTSSTFDAKLAKLKAMVLAHAEEEQTKEFPRLREHYQDDTLVGAAQLIKLAEATGPTHPHPTAGSGVVGNLVLGPFAAVVDRVRDALRDGVDALKR